MAYKAHANNIKVALREARDRCYAKKTTPSMSVEVWDRDLHNLEPISAGLTQTLQGALPLDERVVFLIEEARLGVVRKDGPGYMSLTAKEFTRGMTKKPKRSKKVLKKLDWYFQAIRQLP